jgi:hypothetical protein
MQIKNIKNVETGYYIVLAVHADVAKKEDNFLLLNSGVCGEKDINFFLEIN